MPLCDIVKTVSDISYIDFFSPVFTADSFISFLHVCGHLAGSAHRPEKKWKVISFDSDIYALSARNLSLLCLECHHPDKEGEKASGPPPTHPNYTGCLKCHNDDV